MRRAAVLGALALLVAVGAPTLAADADSATAGSTFGTTSLAAPTGLSATAGCNGLAAKVTLSWTATASTYATGYDVYRAVGAGASTLLTSVAGRTTTTYTDNAVSLLTTYTYVVRARYQSWSKASSSASATTANLCF